MMIPGWEMSFLQKGQIDCRMHAYGKNSEKSVYEELLKADVLYLAHILY